LVLSLECIFVDQLQSLVSMMPCTYFTHSHFLKGEDSPIRIPCNSPLTIEHTLISCIDFDIIHQNYWLNLVCCVVWPNKALNHLLNIPDDGSENSESLNLAVDVVGASNDTKLTTHLMNYLLGDVDGVAKVITVIVSCLVVW